MENKFSIIIPSFNRQEELLTCLLNLNNQTIKNFSVIVVDDASEKPITIDYNLYNYQLLLIRKDINSGAAASRNTGVLYSQSEWIMFLDDDDLFSNEKIAFINEFIQKNTDVDFIYHKAIINMVNENGQYISSVKEEKKLDTEKLLKSNYIGGAPVFIVKRDIFLSINGFNEDLNSIEDYEFLLRLSLLKNIKIYFINKPLTICFYYTKRKSVSKNIIALKLSQHYIYNKYRKPTNKWNIKGNFHYMLANAQLMNLNRKCAYHYAVASILSFDIKLVIGAIFSLVSPNLLIKLKLRFFSGIRK